MDINSAISVLKEGSTIGTRLMDDGIWHQNIIYKLEETTVYVSLLDSYLENVILVGNKMVLKFPLDYFEYLFTGIISEIQPNYPGYVTVQIDSAEELVNTRAFPRFDACIGADIKKPQGDDIFFSIISNISLSGMAFISKQMFDYGEVLEVAIYLPNRSIAYAKGKIIRRSTLENHQSYSMQFIYMDEKNNNSLSKYISILEKRTQDMQHKYFDSLQKFFR